MPIRRTTPRASDPAPQIDAVKAFIYASSDTFTETFLGPGFHSEAEARRLWPRYRRSVWAATRRMCAPRASAVFDGFDLEAPDAVRFVFSHVTIPLTDLLAVIAKDRASVVAFEKRDRKAAAQISDFLTTIRADLDLLERQAKDMAAACRTERRYPCHSWPGLYGRATDAPPAA